MEDDGQFRRGSLEYQTQCRTERDGAREAYVLKIAELKGTKRAIFFGDIRKIFKNMEAIKELETQVELARKNYNHSETEYQFSIGNNPWSLICPA